MISLTQLITEVVNIMWCIYEIIHIWTAVVHESEEWSSQYIFQFKQLERRSLKKIRASTGFEPVTSAIRVRSTNWAMKPHIGSEVNLLSSYLPVRNEMMWCIYEIIHIWTAVVHESDEWSSQYIFQCKQSVSRGSRVRIPLKPWFFQASSFHISRRF